ncbi:MAG: hypothetical protein U1D99_02780, partial [Candidatus Omnitrophota bacterium]|nr:hypothetical protein [Candidatus Omnitrophota bacterium]
GGKGGQFLFEKKFQGRPSGCLMPMHIAFLPQPPAGAGPQIVEILELAVISLALKGFRWERFACCFDRCYRDGQMSEVGN